MVRSNPDLLVKVLNPDKEVGIVQLSLGLVRDPWRRTKKKHSEIAELIPFPLNIKYPKFSPSKIPDSRFGFISGLIGLLNRVTDVIDLLLGRWHYVNLFLSLPYVWGHGPLQKASATEPRLPPWRCLLHDGHHGTHGLHYRLWWLCISFHLGMGMMGTGQMDQPPRIGWSGFWSVYLCDFSMFDMSNKYWAFTWIPHQNDKQLVFS